MKNHHHMLCGSSYRNIQKRSIHRDRQQSSCCQGLEGGRVESDCVTGTFPFRVMKVSCNQSEVLAAQYCDCAICHRTVHFKIINGQFYVM